MTLSRTQIVLISAVVVLLASPPRIADRADERNAQTQAPSTQTLGASPLCDAVLQLSAGPATCHVTLRREGRRSRVSHCSAT
jgi:hypothetical protein